MHWELLIRAKWVRWALRTVFVNGCVVLQMQCCTEPAIHGGCESSPGWYCQLPCSWTQYNLRPSVREQPKSNFSDCDQLEYFLPEAHGTWYVCLSVCLFIISEPAYLDVIAVRLQHGLAFTQQVISFNSGRFCFVVTKAKKLHVWTSYTRPLFEVRIYSWSDPLPGTLEKEH